MIFKPGDSFDILSARDSIFLAGPTPRQDNIESWRTSALQIFKNKKYYVNFFVPEPFYNLDSPGNNYFYQIDWENRALKIADVIMFWVPRNLETMPAFTTNVEFGAWIKSGKVVYGRPDDAPKCGYLDWHARDNGVPILNTLPDTIMAAIELLSMKKPLVYG